MSPQLLHRFLFAPLVACVWTTLPALALSAPTISPSTGSYSTQQTVTMSADPGVSIYFTEDGTSPVTSSTRTLYSAAIPISNPTQLNAVAYQSGTHSALTTAYLDVDPALTPIVLPGTQTFPALRLRSTFGLQTGVGSPAGVTQWIDLSGWGVNATGTAGSLPTVVARTTGWPVVRFDGSSQYLSLPAGNLNGDYDGATIFVVTKPNALTAGSRIFDYGQGASGNDVLFQINSSSSYGNYSTYSGTSASSVTSAPTAMSQGVYQLLEAIQTTASPYTGTFYINGTAGTSASMNFPSRVNRNSNFLGQASAGGNFYSGDIAEVLIYYGQINIPGQLTNSQRMAIETLLLQKYQMFSQIPSTPKISVPTSTLLQPTQVVIAGQPGTNIFITTDGTDPTSSSTEYNGTPIQINYTQTLKAIAIKNGVPSPSIATATYTLNANQFPPTGSDVTAPSINLDLPAPSL